MSTISGAGLKRFFNKVVKANKSTPKMKEMVRSENLILRKFGRATAKNAAKHRRFNHHAKRISFTYTSQFARSAAMLSNREEYTGLSRALSQLADVEEKIENLHTEQATLDAIMLCELFKDYIALIGAVREAFHEQVKVYHHLEHAQMMRDEKVTQ